MAAKPASPARGHPERSRDGGAGVGEPSQVPEVPRAVGLPGKPVRRNCRGAPLQGGTSRCLATRACAAGGLCAPCSEPSVAPGPSAGSFPCCPQPVLASRNRCPWHYLPLSGSLDTLAPTCTKAKLHRKRGGPSPDMASTLTDGAARAMSTGTYTYTSRPRALPCQRRRYRDYLMQRDEEPMPYGNIMYDRRVIRGNTYALQTGPPKVRLLEKLDSEDV